MLKQKVLALAPLEQESGMLRFPRKILATHGFVLLLLTVGTLFLIFRSNLGHFDDSYVFADNVTQDWPAQEYFNQRLRNGELPLWNPYQSAGNPTIGTLQHRLLYPPRLLLTLILGLDLGQLLELLFHFSLGLFGTYFMLRSFLFRPGPACVGALSFLLANDYLASYNVTQNLIATIVWVPVCLATINRFLQRQTLAHVVAMAVAHSMLVYAGHPQYGFFAAHACMILFFAGACIKRRQIVRHFARFIAYSLLGAVLLLIITGPQLFASFEFFSQGWRGEAGLSFLQFNPYGGRSALQILPEAIGGVYKPHMQILNLIMVLGLVVGYWRLPVFRSRILAICLIATPFFLLAMAGTTPVADWFYHYYPLGSAFRYPQRASWVLLFPCAFVFALLTQAIAKRDRKKSHNLLRARVFLGLWILVFLAVVVPQKRLRTQAFLHVTELIRTFAGDVKQAIPEQNQFRFDSICAFFFLEPCQKAGVVSRRLSLNDYEPANTYRSYLLARLLSEKVGDGPAFDLWLGETNLTFVSLANLSAVNMLRASSVKWILGDSRLWKQTSEQVRTQMLANGIGKPAGVIVNHAAQKLMLERYGSGFTTEFLQGFGGELPLYHIFKIDGEVAPRAYLSNRIRYSPNAKNSFALLQAANPMQVTIVESDTPLLMTNRTKEIDHMRSVHFEVDEPEHIVLASESSGDAMLILNDKFYSGWTATVDSQPTVIHAANLGFRAVQVPAGKHTIEFAYKPRAFLTLLILSLFGYATACYVGIKTVLARRMMRPR
ncbi:MAG: YfhO family protein [Spirochaetia bacterium]|nr:YfhO family protein [Spirochaetia bacterium]